MKGLADRDVVHSLASEIYQIAVEPATAAGPPCVGVANFVIWATGANDTVVRDFARGSFTLDGH